MKTNKYGRIPVVCDECKVLFYIFPDDIMKGCKRCKSTDVSQVSETEASRLKRNAFNKAKENI